MALSCGGRRVPRGWLLSCSSSITSAWNGSSSSNRSSDDNNAISILTPHSCNPEDHRRFGTHAASFGSDPNSSAEAFGPIAPLPTRRVVVTGIGLVTPLGVGVASSWGRLLAGDSGLRQLTEQDLPELQRPALASLPCRVAGLVPEQQLQAAVAHMGLAEEARRSSRFALLALLAAEEALADAGWGVAARQCGLDNRSSSGSSTGSSSGGGGRGGALTLTPAQLEATGVAVGNGMSCTTEVSEAGALVTAGRGRRVSPFFVPRILPNMAAGAISIRHGFRGPNHAVSTACATGAHGLGDAYRMVQRGDADVMVAGASEACVDAVSLMGFSRLKALSTAFNDQPHAASRPFDARRDGFVMGEGAGVLVLEERGHAEARGAHLYAEVRGYGLSGDAHHVTHPHPYGGGALLCMRRALAGSGVAARQLSYVNAHATSTPAGDAIELAALAQLLGAELEASGAAGAAGTEEEAAAAGLAVGALPPGPLPLVGSTKGATGHLLGAAGAVEAAFAVLALHYRRVPPTLNLEEPDPPLLPCLVGPAAAQLPPRGPLAALSNSFGFGGTNASLLFTTP